MKTFVGIILGLTILVNCYQFGQINGRYKTEQHEVRWLPLPKLQCEKLPSGQCDDLRAQYERKPVDMMTALAKAMPRQASMAAAFDFAENYQ